MRYQEKDGTGSISPLVAYLMGPGRSPDGALNPPNDRAKFLGGRGFGVPIGTSEQDRRLAEIMLNANNSRLLQASGRIVKTNLHVSMNWDRGQTPTDEDMMEAARKMARTIQMPEDEYMFAVIRHNEKSYPHAHVVLSRRNIRTGMAAPDFQRQYRGLHWSVNHDREMRDTRGIPIPKTLQWREDRAQAVIQNDHKKLEDLLFKRGFSDLDQRPTIGEAVVKKSAIDQAAAMGGKFGAQLEAHREQWIEANDLLRLRKGTSTGPEMGFTTAQIYRHEQQIIAIANELRHKPGFGIDDRLVDEVIRKRGMGQDQAEGIRWATRNNGFAVIIGEAGTGKSYVNKGLKEVHEQAKFPFYGASTSNNVVQQMLADGIESRTLWGWNNAIARHEKALRKWEAANKKKRTPKPIAPIKKGAVWALEEGFQTSDVDFCQFCKHVKKHEGKIIVVMDKEQHGPVERGGTLAPLEQKFGSAKLTDIRRNNDPDTKRAWNAMHRGKKKDWQLAADIFDRKGAIHYEPTKPETISKVVRDYMEHMRQHPDQSRQVVAMRNDEVDEINKKIQLERLAAGQLGAGANLKTDRGVLRVHVGDRVRLAQSVSDQEQKRKGAINGAYGTAKGIKELPDGTHELTFEADRKPKEQRRMFSIKVGEGKDAIKGVRYGYAGTSCNSQGRTIDHVQTVHDPMNSRTSTYVGLTRNSKSAKFYVSSEDTESKEELVDQMRHGDRKRSAHDYVLDDVQRAKMERMPRNPTPTPSPYPSQKPAPTPKPSSQLHHIFGSAPKKKLAAAASAARSIGAAVRSMRRGP